MTAPRDVVDLLQQLVRIPSVNPAGQPASVTTGEGRCGAFVAEFLQMCGADVEVRDVEPGRPNVLAIFPSDRAGKKRLLFAPHLDTVGVDGMTIDPFAAGEHGGRIHGRGSCDTKGSIAAMLWAFYESREQLRSLSHEIRFAGLMGEETGNEGALALAADAWADFVIVGEPTNLHVVHAHKGALWLRLTTQGVSVHSSAPQLGRNAIYAMADVIRFLRDDIAPELARSPHPLLGAATVNIGICAGGSKINIVPDRCVAELDVRTVPPADAAFVENLTARLRSASADVEIEVMREARPLCTDASHEMVRCLQTLGADLTTAPWFSDASVFADQGIPAVCVGPGSIQQAHTADEWISVAELKLGVKFYRALLASC